MPISWLNLLEDEHTIWRDNPSKLMLLPAITLGLLLTFVYVAIIVRGLIPGDTTTDILRSAIIFPLAYLPLALTELRRRNIEYVITNKRVAKKTGIISRHGDPINASNIQNIKYTQGVVDRLLDVGELQVMTSGRGDIDMRWRSLRHPKSVADIVSDQTDKTL
jgi:uncharacterized membrane protein YdbT with pleckstrin-like domain